EALDLHHVGAGVTELHRCIRARDALGQFDDLVSVQRPHYCFPPVEAAAVSVPAASSARTSRMISSWCSPYSDGRNQAAGVLSKCHGGPPVFTVPHDFVSMSTR